MFSQYLLFSIVFNYLNIYIIYYIVLGKDTFISSPSSNINTIYWFYYFNIHHIYRFTCNLRLVLWKLTHKTQTIFIVILS